MEKKPFSTNAANRVCTPECTNSTYNSWHKFDVHSLIPLDVNASPYEKRERRGEREGWARNSHHRILIRVSSLRYRFNTPWSDCTLRLHVQSLRPTATNQDQAGEKEGGKRKEGCGEDVAEENQSSSVRNRLSSEGDREYNKQRRSLRGRRQSPRRAHTRATTPFEIAVHRFTISKIYPLEGGWFCRESSRERKRHLNSYVPW